MFRFEYGETNVYAQLGFADAEEIPLKVEIVKDIAVCIRAAGITLADAAAMLGTVQSDLALVLCGKFQDIRADELRGWLARLISRLW
ncbi:XRE family transcriptional regulator [Cupriavidus sp. IDO]|uniref:XRE family transcriptional regulator n=1 Tax=Cupriavidus sp. IDO TaxID=1539142 RepID=UPI00057984AB|nr:XRE family transcriptional regulator [Cupriavidus sp. IDO]KWR88411.1 XRE family transcriptional regulator [Cupriavidus sp. IDO]